MEIIKSDYSHDYKITYTSKTVREVLEEIKEYTNHDKRFGRLREFGHPESPRFGNCWVIYINNKIYLSCWVGESPDNLSLYKEMYDEADLDKKVSFITGNGGWYCGININIYTE